jgi:hypothetical protein
MDIDIFMIGVGIGPSIIHRQRMCVLTFIDSRCDVPLIMIDIRKSLSMLFNRVERLFIGLHRMAFSRTRERAG